MRIAAFDPGINGSAALYRSGEFLDMVDLATVPDGENKQLDAAFICDLLERWLPDEVVIENVQVAVMPQKNTTKGGGRRSVMSPSSAFRFGIACGVIRGVVAVYGIPVTMVHPRSWKGYFGLSGSDKKPHVRLIKERYPSSAKFITLEKHHGRADAGLMAAWHAERAGLLADV